MNDAKEEIRDRLPVEDVVGQYVELKRSGRTLKGHSPWGVDKTPSLMVSPDKGIWHDFSANKGGDIFTFVMEVEGISFREALEKLAAQAGVDLSKYKMGDAAVTKKKARAREALELACKFYQVCLTKNKEVMQYVFYKRNMNRATVKEFRIGYAPKGKDYLVQFLKKRGFTIQEMRDAGLLNQYDGDLFRGRMMVPFMDNSGSVIGFTGRIVGDGEPKYLNTPETLLFNKSRFIFGLTQAKESIRRDDFAVIVEGNMDVISSHQAGVKHAVATSGTAMTEGHLKILSKLTSDIRLAYDGDAAGVNATERAIMLAGGIGVNLSVISGYGTAKDPDELIQQDPKLWQECVEKHEPAVDWILKKYEESVDILTGPGKREYSDMAMRVIGFLSDPVEKRHYEKLVARRLDVSVEDLVAKKIPTEKRRLKPVKTTADGEKSDMLSSLVDRMEAILIYGGEAGKMIQLEEPTDEMRKSELELVFNEKYGKFAQDALRLEAEELNKRYDIEMKRRKIEELTTELDNAADDDEKTAEILRQITSLRREMK